MSDASEPTEAAAPAGADLAALAEGLWRRMRDVILVAERVETFTFGEGEPARIALTPEDASALATETVLRALRAAGDATNFRILASATAAGGESPGAPIEDLAASLGIGRLAVSERVGDLQTAGLVARDLEHDRAVATAAGAALVALTSDLTEDLGRRAREARGRGDGLPVL